MAQFNLKKAKQELASFLSVTEHRLDKEQYPNLAKMSEAGSKLNWQEYFDGKRKASS